MKAHGTVFCRRHPDRRGWDLRLHVLLVDSDSLGVEHVQLADLVGRGKIEADDANIIGPRLARQAMFEWREEPE